MTSDEFFPVPDDKLPAPQDDQPEDDAGDLDADRPDAAAEESAAALETESSAAEPERDEAGDAEEPAAARPSPPQIVDEQPIGEERLAAPGPQPDVPAPPEGESLSEPAEAEVESEPELAAEEDAIAGAPAVAESEPEAADETPPAEEEPIAGAPTVTEVEPEAADETPPAEPEPIRSRSALAAPAPEAEPAEPVEPARPDEWGDDISPELAAILFAGAASTTEAPAREAAAPAEEEAPAPEEKAAPRPRPAAGPVNLIDVDDARRLPITAGGVASPAPDEQPEGRARYVRVEEPLGKEDGQRISETWSYLKPDYPSLEGRLVRRVHIEEHRYADGSWKWTFERQYADRGRDTREVRANRDRTYIERHDRIAKKDLSANKRVRAHEKGEMILAGPEHEEKRGFLSRLLGRGEKTAGGPAEWRPATSSEARSARSDGGQAFGRKLFGLF